MTRPGGLNQPHRRSFFRSFSYIHSLLQSFSMGNKHDSLPLIPLPPCLDEQSAAEGVGGPAPGALKAYIVNNNQDGNFPHRHGQGEQNIPAASSSARLSSRYTLFIAIGLEICSGCCVNRLRQVICYVR